MFSGHYLRKNIKNCPPNFFFFNFLANYYVLHILRSLLYHVFFSYFCFTRFFEYMYTSTHVSTVRNYCTATTISIQITLRPCYNTINMSEHKYLLGDARENPYNLKVGVICKAYCLIKASLFRW